MKERVKFVLEWEKRWNEGEGQVNISELCRVFGISRERGYVWIGRYREAGRDIKALAERSRRPVESPTAVAEEVQELVVAYRKAYPSYGPNKIKSRLTTLRPNMVIPSSSAIGALLSRRGLTVPRKRRRRPGPTPGVAAPFSACEQPNNVWCIDFKGWFRTEDQVRCYPLTLLDAYSRYELRCEGLIDPDGPETERVLDSAFQEFGLPDAMRSDSGPPFASTGVGGLTKLSVWLLKLGIRVERIAPGHPEQNGRLERFHRTLKAETASPPAENLRAQQRAFDLWRREYNEVRPHEALGQRTPASVYARSSKRYPRRLISPEPPWDSRSFRVDKQGFIRWYNGRRTFISTALSHEQVALDPTEREGCWDVRYGPILLGRLNEARLERGIVPKRRRRGAAKVSAMSLD